MFLHLMKIVWNRKQANLLIVAEILISFVVVFALLAGAFHLVGNFRRPTGYDYRDVWSVSASRNSDGGYGDWTEEEQQRFHALLADVKAIDFVNSVSGASTGPYFDSVSTSGWDYKDGTSYRTEVAWVTESFEEALGLRLVEGRWFERGDEALTYKPVVVDRDFAMDIAGEGGSALGQEIREAEDDQRAIKVIGVVDDFRRGGEFASKTNYMFLHASERYTEDSEALGLILVKVAPGTRAEHEETLISRMQAIAPSWTFRVRAMEAEREQNLKRQIVPMVVGGLVSGFLLLMVVLGLTGVLWQNVTRRTREIGLRRATGATRQRVHRQILGEVMITAGLGVILGAAVALQGFWLLPLEFVRLSVVFTALGSAMLFMVLLATLCGLYPGWSATRVQPAEALHYE